MKKTLLILTAVIATHFVGTAQNFTPGPSALPQGTLGESYVGQTLAFDVPTSVTISTADLGLPIPFEVDADISDVTWTVEGLPNGLTATCDISSCNYDGGATGTITISGTPTESGSFTINITSETNGSADVQGNVVDFPQPLPGLLDESGYTLSVVDPNGIQDLDPNRFDITMTGENPFTSSTSFGISMVKPGNVVFTFTDLSGRVADRLNLSLKKGLNEVEYNSDLSSGKYIYTVEFEGKVLTGKLAVL